MVCPAHESMQAMWGRYVSQVLLEKGALLFREKENIKPLSLVSNKCRFGSSYLPKK
jgi:hypothetical protein